MPLTGSSRRLCGARGWSARARFAHDLSPVCICSPAQPLDRGCQESFRLSPRVENRAVQLELKISVPDSPSPNEALPLSLANKSQAPPISVKHFYRRSELSTARKTQSSGMASKAKGSVRFTRWLRQQAAEVSRDVRRRSAQRKAFASAQCRQRRAEVGAL